ncbi:MAG: L-seryl-tRNA(Sec) selenium transferase, partial [Pseudomonadales bacterium]|nr:L-seryl-tRNA(Sec) selenium transferase [Pseudomonadales bacterium]
LRVDKMTITALTEVLKLYLEPETLAHKLPTLRHLSRNADDIQAIANQLLPHLAEAINRSATVKVVETHSQIGSGALPLDQLPSFAIAMTPHEDSDAALQTLSSAFRNLPVPVIGRLADGTMLLDCRTLDDPNQFIRQLESLALT